MGMKYILTNFGCGNGPFLRAIDWALGIREKLTEEVRILVPDAYGEKMRRLVREDFPALLENDPDLFVFHPALGAALQNLLYDGKDFSLTLQKLIENYPATQAAADEILSGQSEGLSMSGAKVAIAPEDIVCTVSRNPNLRLGKKSLFYSSIGFFERILRAAEDEEVFARYGKADLEKAAELMRQAEDGWDMYLQPMPSVFSYDTRPLESWKEGTSVTPPLFHPPQPTDFAEELEPGIYVLVSGIPYLDRLYSQVTKLGWTLYTNQPTPNVPAARVLHPRFVGHPSIQGVYARAAWNTIWLANLNRKPLLCPPFLADDFPEIFFNNRSVEKLGLGVIMTPELEAGDAIDQAKALQPGIDAYYAEILKRFGTLDGIEYAATLAAQRLTQNQPE